MFCDQCGKEIKEGHSFCTNCGAPARWDFVNKPTSAPAPEQSTAQSRPSGMTCPKCGSHNVEVSVVQENLGSKTVTKTKSKYKEKGHGCMWWLLIGSWWWIIDLFLWVFVFPIRFLIQLFKKKKYVGDANTVSNTSNKIKYKSVRLCKNCGHHWER